MQRQATVDTAAPVVVWFRQDLRLADNPSVQAAAASGQPFVGLYVLDDATPGRWRIGGAGRWWLHHSLAALARDITTLGGTLVLRRGPAATVVPAFLAEVGATTIHWSRCYEPFAVTRDTALKAALKQAGVRVESHKASLLYEPWEVTTASGGPFKVYTPFWRACLRNRPDFRVLAAPSRLAGPLRPIATEELADWQLLPCRPNWARRFSPQWQPGSAGAAAKLNTFLERAIANYADGRNRPDQPLTSGLSPHLHFGEISPRQVFSAVEAALHTARAPAKDVEKFCAELGWREFAYHLLHHNPTLPEANFRPEFDRLGWSEDVAGIAAWRAGQTGYPIVDAGMRQLWATGWMHNRVRMITASFLIKHLMVDWRVGQDWFWDTLVDADLANNAASWQWVAGSGADAAPYFRIFNPVTQGERFDPHGDYVRTFVPELSGLPASVIHQPWTAPPLLLQEAGVRLGSTYPAPIVDHASARTRALAAFARLKQAA